MTPESVHLYVAVALLGGVGIALWLRRWPRFLLVMEIVWALMFVGACLATKEILR